ncbi:MAG TPA: extracellular solute-binding protein [Dongiaceae bacterium]|jgi:ABC-type glycerol-3-phosphate transport system substrate-binding protein|nr:extracellular solute-binding protein [Dongiaceae bacterium]
MDGPIGLSRRRMLEIGAALGASSAMGGLLPSMARADTELNMWWWGEQELPGLKDFVADSVANYKDATVKTLLQDTAVVQSQFQTAAAAGKAPDIQYFWNGIYHMESVWLGYVKPLDGLMNADILKASQPTLLSDFDGHIYRMGWYPIPMLWVYNKDCFEKAKLDPDTPPATWDDFMNACDKLKSAGISPVGGGIQDGYWGEWYWGHAIAQIVDTPGEAIQLFTGEKDFTDPKYFEPWARLEDLKKKGFLNPEMSSTELYPGIDLIVAGKVAMGESTGTRMPADNEKTKDRIGAMVMPVFGKSKLAGQPIFDTQGLGISKDAKDPKAAVAFLEYLQSPERLKVFHEKTGWIPSNSTFDTSVITDKVVVDMWKKWGQGPNIPYLSNVVPGQFYDQALLPTSQQVVSGKSTGEEAGALAAKVAKEWRDFNPDMVDNYKKWAKDLG